MTTRAVRQWVWRVLNVARVVGERVYVGIDGATAAARGEMKEGACSADGLLRSIRDMAC